MIVDSHVVHVKVDLTHAAAYDDLFPPSLFTEPPTQLAENVLHAGETATGVNVVDDAFEDVEEIGSFVGKTKVNKFHNSLLVPFVVLS